MPRRPRIQYEGALYHVTTRGNERGGREPLLAILADVANLFVAGFIGGVEFSARVEVVEYLGDEQLVHLLLREPPVLAKLPVEQRVRDGEELMFSVPREKLHLFDAATEQALPA